jgi:F0F1-type ATP synthase assembly protein I
MIKNLLDDDNDQASHRETETSKTHRPHEPAVITLFDSIEDPAKPADEPYLLSSTPVESAADTIRRSGMAWSLGIAFVAAVGFMLILGWGADLLLGTSPWGVVVGIVLGSIIGFFQLFRLSSQIFKN